MTESSPEEVQLGSSDLESEKLNVIRDNTFVRCVADRGIVLDLGRDMEIGFLQVGPNILSMTDHGETEGLALDPVLTEIARIRMPWPSVMDLAMNVIREGVGKGAVNVPLVLEAIKSYADHPETMESDESVENGSD